jgi:hypothetical protein
MGVPNKFNIGQWVRNTKINKVFRYTSLDAAYDKDNPTHSKYDEPWHPQYGEPCWFWDKDQLNNHGTPHFGTYGILSYTLDFYDFCEPFIKDYPSFYESQL